MLGQREQHDGRPIAAGTQVPQLSEQGPVIGRSRPEDHVVAVTLPDRSRSVRLRNRADLMAWLPQRVGENFREIVVRLD